MASSLRVLIVVLAVSTSLRRAAAAAPITVEEACKQYTEFPDFCAKTLSAAPPEMKTAAGEGLPGIAELSVSLAEQICADTLKFVQGLANSPGGMPPACLEACVTKFQLVLEQMKRSKVAMMEAKDSDATKMLTTAHTDGDICVGGCMKVEGGGELHIVDKISNLGKICVIAQSLTEASVRNPTA